MRWDVEGVRGIRAGIFCMKGWLLKVSPDRKGWNGEVCRIKRIGVMR